MNEFLSLFDQTESKLLSNWGIGEFPSILDGSTRVKEQPQDVSKDTLAPKVCEP